MAGDDLKIHSEEGVICEVRRPNGNNNAKLISKAPEMYEVLKDAYFAECTELGNRDWLNKAKEIIKQIES